MNPLGELKQIKIGGIIYEIKIVDRLSGPDGLLNGFLKHSNTVIQLDDKLNSQAFMQTLLHEIFHTIFAQLGRQDAKENFVDSLAFSMLQVLRDNPKLLELIRGLDAGTA